MNNKNEINKSGLLGNAHSLKEQANEYFRNNEFQRAIDLYSTAIDIADLNSEEKSIIFSNRSLAYLKLHENSNVSMKVVLKKALSDAQQACSLNPKWFKAHARLGKIYMELNNIEMSIKNYEKALSLKPDNSELKNSLANAKFMQFEQNRMGHLDEENFPNSMDEYETSFLNLMKERFGHQTEMHDWENKKNAFFAENPIYEALWKGHEYRNGSKNVKQNYEMAAKYFGKAAIKGNAEAIYNLALLNMQGLGVKLDFEMAITLLKQAASQPAQAKIMGMKQPNPGVAEAQHTLGLLYENGIYFDKNPLVASSWYERAVENEFPNSANNLGLMYMNGIGVDKDLQRAEKLLLMAHRKGNTIAITNLVNLYINMNNPDNVMLWHKRGLESNSFYELNRREQIIKIVEEMRKVRMKILGEDVNNNIDLNGLSIEEQIKKYFSAKGIESEEFMENLMKLKNIKTSRNPGRTDLKYDRKMLEEYAKKGSSTAKRMYSAMNLFDEALTDLYIYQNNRRMSTNLKETVFKMYYAYKTCQFICQVPIEIFDFLVDTLKSIVQENKTSELDMQARICLMILQSADLKQTIKFINASLEKYPKNFRMIFIRGHLYGFLNENKKALDDLRSLVEIEKDEYEEIESLIALASVLKLNDQEENRMEAVKVYESFISKAAKDHRSIPEAFYSIAYCYLLNKKAPKGEMVQKAAEYYKKGQEAEKSQLPCFFPIQSQAKIFVNSILAIDKMDFSGLKEKKNTNQQESHKEDSLIIKDEHRVNVIKAHREFVGFLKKSLKENLYAKQFSVKPPKKQESSFQNLKKITFKEIDFTKDHVLKGFVLHVRNIDVPAVGSPGTHFVIEDEHKHVEHLSVYNLGTNYEKILQEYGIGVDFEIANPYARIASDGKSVIRVDDPKSIKLSRKVSEKICRNCGKDDSKFNCAKCKVAFYCSKECQSFDWKKLDHKKICN
jgi:TPR repeat protein